MLTCEILSSMHHVFKMTSSENNALVPDFLPLPTTNNVTYVHARVASLLGSFYELSTLKLIYTGRTTAAYAAPCRKAVSFTQLLIDVYFFFVLLRTYASRCERCSRELLSSKRNYLFFFRKHAYLCPTSSRYPSTNATCVSPTSRFDVNEQKPYTLRKAARSLPHPPGHL